ncbi:MAG: hypothetical protein MZU97_26575 [Bacillus subtilis]|nr:hypothetical protein [Bacillus subtilis]
MPETIQMDKTPTSFPGKLLQFLIARYEHFEGSDRLGLDIVACELIDDNGDQLKAAMLELAKYNQMDPTNSSTGWFVHNRFYNTLGRPHRARDTPKTTPPTCKRCSATPTTRWSRAKSSICGSSKDPSHFKTVLPFDQSGSEVFYVESIKPYKQRKVKILNGVAHGDGSDRLLAWQDRRQRIDRRRIDSSNSCRGFVFDEVVPTIALPEADMKAFANSVFERYQNPFIHHLALIDRAQTAFRNTRAGFFRPSLDNLAKGTVSAPRALQPSPR